MIGAWVDARFDDVLNCVERLARWVLERRSSNVWPDNLHGAEIRRNESATEVEPAGSVVRDTPASAAGGVAGEDAPQNQPSTRFTPLPVDEPCDMGAQPVGEHLDPNLLRSENPIYQQLINENLK